MTAPAREHISHDTIAARLPFYYGWVMLGVTIVASLAFYPGQTVGIAEFNAYFLDDLGLSQTQLSGAYMIATFIAGIAALFAGAAMDRYGLRRTIAVTIVLMSASCLFASQVGGLWSLFIAFLLLRVFGHGALPLLTGNTLAMWFHRRLGFVTGVAGVAGGFVMAVVPISYLWLIQIFGWRWAWVVLGLAVCALMLPIIAFLFRNGPDEVGQQIDGITAEPDAAAGDSADAARHEGTLRSLDLVGAFHTRSYWILLALSVAHGMVFAAVMFHRVQIFQAHNLTNAQAAAMVAVFSMCLAATQLIAGVLADRVPLHLLVFTSSLGIAVSLVILARLDSLFMAFTFGAICGAGTGVEIVGRNTMWPRYFGRRHLGKIKGSAIMASVIGSSIGPFVVGWNFDTMGRYDLAIWALAGIYGAIAIALLFATPPREETTSNGLVV